MAKSKQKELTADEAAQVLRVHPRTIRNMIARKEIRGKKVGSRWFVDKNSLSGLDNKTKSSKPVKTSSEKSLRQLAVYRLCVHAFQTFTWTHGNAQIAKFLEEHKIKVISEIGAGYYSYGKYKNECYVRARYYLGSIVALLEAFPEDSLIKAREFIELECLPAFGNLIRKIETIRGNN